MPPNPVTKLSAFGDESNVSFIGILPERENSQIKVFFHCKRHNLNIELHERIQLLVSRGVEMSEEQGKELIELSRAAADEGPASRRFLIGTKEHPNLKFDACSFLFTTNGKSCIIRWVSCSTNAIYTIMWLFSRLRERSNPFDSYDHLYQTFLQIIKENSSKVKLIEELDEETGYGVFVKRLNE